MTENELSHVIIGAAIEVHRELGGPGLLEGVYEEALCAELDLRRIPVRRQVEVPVIYKGRRLERTYRLDVLVAELVIVEVKAVESIHSIHQAQLLTELRITNKKLGLLINFGQQTVKEGVKRVVNGL
ncbi:MAG: GxxExxY protein [Planctomycetota bacterium]|nr:MAG: GxxExxY protein [Planctomycetota bacterium]